MSNSIQLFDFNEVPVRIMVIDDQPWWVAADVCRVLDLTNPTVALAELDEDERAKGSLDRQRKANLISESGLYSLIFRSRKPEAQTFRKWVTSEVLPAIRRTGRYAPPAQPTPVARPEPTPAQRLTTKQVERLRTLAAHVGELDVQIRALDLRPEDKEWMEGLRGMSRMLWEMSVFWRRELPARSGALRDR